MSDRSPCGSYGVVVIGRNEGERLARCFGALTGHEGPLVYVDSGSTDRSVELARGFGAEVVELDDSRPYSAARARNAGFEFLRRIAPETRFVQFVDGDSELDPAWLERAAAYLSDHPDVAMVCGRLRERHPDASAYHRLAAIEWDAPVGEIRACGGNAMAQRAAYESAAGYRETMIAGEEPDLCRRMRSEGHRIVRLPDDMATHDSGPLGFGHWWRRAIRSGHAYAEILYRQLPRPEPPAVRSVLSILWWGGVLPFLTLVGAVPTAGWSLVGLALYLVLFLRIARSGEQRGLDASAARLYALACIAEKPASFVGVGRFLWNSLIRRRSTPLIES